MDDYRGEVVPSQTVNWFIISVFLEITVVGHSGTDPTVYTEGFS
ncbi:hypothetical protein SAMN04487898_109207 [Pedobacter sp. ok626]|nr:hypothetical protein [Pedobacter sp. ok626]SDK58945.1 hypothetical protein SAMN04487898_109207 [Pedobacter sp. ok626]